MTEREAWELRRMLGPEIMRNFWINCCFRQLEDDMGRSLTEAERVTVLPRAEEFAADMIKKQSTSDELRAEAEALAKDEGKAGRVARAYLAQTS